MSGEHGFRTHVRANAELITLWMVLAIHGLLLGWISVVNAPMFDEIGHLPSGLAHWQYGNFDLYRVNPPLMRMIAAIPLLVVDPKTDWTSISDGPYARPEFIVGSRFMQANGYDSFWLFTICRWAQIPVSIFGGWICYRWARKLYGASSGFVAVLLWCFCPNVLAWGSAITPDIGGAAFGVAAGYTFWRWLKTPNWNAALLAGTALGLAELSKSTWIVLFALWPVVWAGWRYCVRSLPKPKATALQLASLWFVGLYLLNLGYGFESSFQPLGKFEFISQAMGGLDSHTTPGNRFRGTWFEAIPVPVPANYLRGIDVQKYDFEEGKWSYLRGEQKLGGWWSYYLYALGVKTPLGTLILFGVACVLVIVGRGYRLSFYDEMIVLVPAITVIVLVSSQTGFNRYLRYVLPAIPFLLIFASRAAKAVEMKHVWIKAICTICLAAAILESLMVFPHSISFFNLAAAGPFGGPRHLLDANLDWGQDLLELNRFVERHPDVNPIRLAYFGYADPKLLGFPFERFHPSEPQSLSDLKSGWYAISVNHVYGYRHYESDKPTFNCFQQLKPDATAGYSIFLYHITDESGN